MHTRLVGQVGHHNALRVPGGYASFRQRHAADDQGFACTCSSAMAKSLAVHACSIPPASAFSSLAHSAGCLACRAQHQRTATDAALTQRPHPHTATDGALTQRPHQAGMRGSRQGVVQGTSHRLVVQSASQARLLKAQRCDLSHAWRAHMHAGRH